MHIVLQNELYLFQIAHTEFQSKRNRDELASETKNTIKGNGNDFAMLLQKQLAKSNVQSTYVACHILKGPPLIFGGPFIINLLVFHVFRIW